MTTKVLVACDVAGRFSELFTAAGKAHRGKAGPFDALLCVGRFFGPSPASDAALDPYLCGDQPVPLPTFFITGGEDAVRHTPTVSIPDGGELCPNLTFLGRCGKRQISGLSVCYLSGSFDPAVYGGKAGEGGGGEGGGGGGGGLDEKAAGEQRPRGRYTEAEVEELLIEAGAYRKGQTVDVLLTAEWGVGVENLIDPEARPLSEEDLARNPLSPAGERLGKELSMRYHFAAGQSVALQLQPYKNRVHTTRFYGLATPDVLKCKAFAIPHTPGGKPSAQDIEARNAATPNPYLSPRRVSLSAYLTVPSKKPVESGAGKDQGGGEEDARESSSEPGSIKPPRMRLLEEEDNTRGDDGGGGREPDPMHTEFPDTGDWRCGYCDNVNRARFGQVERCNMRFCRALHYAAKKDKRGPLSAQAAAILALQKGEEHQGEEKDDEGEDHGSEAVARTNSADGQADGDGLDEDGSSEGNTKKKKKRVSIYSNQGGGLSNPVKRYKKGRRPGDPNGPSYVRAKW